jgi:hypothetical protein
LVTAFEFLLVPKCHGKYGQKTDRKTNKIALNISSPSLVGLGKRSAQLEESFLCPTSFGPSAYEHTPKVCPAKMKMILSSYTNLDIQEKNHFCLNDCLVVMETLKTFFSMF